MIIKRFRMSRIKYILLYFSVCFAITFFLMANVLHRPSSDTRQVKSSAFKRKTKTSVLSKITKNQLHVACFVELQNELRSLQLSDVIHPEKLNRIKLENSPYFVTQETCEDICKKLPVIPVNMTDKYKPIGNLSAAMKLEADIHKVIESNQPNIPGGGWTYKERNQCTDKTGKYNQTSVAIVIAFRERWIQLTSVLSTLIPLLRRQRLCYRIFVTEQAGTDLFNRGMLFNVGFMEAIQRFHFDCVTFHDADLAPINDLNPYGCDKQTFEMPIHLGVGLDIRKFRLNYPKLIGGVLKMSNQHFVQVNGHSNLYWGWGQEDDDLERRLKYVNIGYYQMPSSIARYKALPHKIQNKDGNTRRIHLKLLATATERMHYDGLSSLYYKVLQVTEHKLFTHLLVDLGKQPNFYNC
uniref:Beta-1,4-galactosyltransferase n=1 Tax=Trichobilharzia regenti TaxID=157069 RepID=A0AA85KFC7_TRIRE|nr:unnamed protein product [Trichobilharzia regenti]